jgi:hypothetical protein
MPTGLSRRQHRRIDVDKDVTCKGFDGGQAVEGYTRNISYGGICLLADCALPKGVELEFSFSLDNQHVLSCRGKVVWLESFSIGDQNGWDHGIQFTDVSVSDRDAI